MSSPDPAHRRINEAGDPVPSSQDSVTRAVQNLPISDSPTASMASPAPPLPTMGNSRRQPRAKQQPREYLRCAHCGSDPAAHVASSDHGLMRHMGQKHGGQRLLPESIGQLRHLGRGAFVVRGAIRSRRCNRCSFCNNTPLRELRVGDTFQDRRQAGQDVAHGGTSIDQPLSQSSQPVPPGEPLDNSPLPNCPIRNIVLTDREKHLLSELRRASAKALPRCVVATAWAESLEGPMSRHQSWALLCRDRCRLLLAEILKGVDRISELKQRLQLWESGQVSVLIGQVLGQQNSGPLRRTARKTQPQTDEQRGRRACAQTARGSISKAMKGLVSGAAQGRLSQELDHSPHPTELGHRNSPHQCGVCRGRLNCLGRRKIETVAERDEGAGTEQNRHRFTATRQSVASECLWSHW